MLRKIRLIVILWYFVLMYIYTMNAQSLFNLEFHKDFGCTGVDMLYEDSSYYYVIGYAQAKDKVEVGVMVNKHDKKSGELKHSAYFDVENVWLGYGSRPGVVQMNNSLYFCLSGRSIFYLLEYNKEDNYIKVYDTIHNAAYVTDLKIYSDSTFICTYETLGSDNKGYGAVAILKPDGT